MKNILLWLLRYLAPHAEAGEDDGPVDDAVDDFNDDVDDGLGDGETVNEEVAERKAKADDKPDRVEEALRTAREATEQVAALQRQAQQRPDPSHDEEERKLRDPATTDLERWQIQSNRALRQSQQQSTQALFQAQDMADKTTYQIKAASNPVYDKYKDKVEAELQKARAQGSNIQREVILQVLIGRDMLAGNFKAAAAKVKAKDIPRGKSPGARSDTPSRAGGTDHQKRIARLQDVQI